MADMQENASTSDVKENAGRCMEASRLEGNRCRLLSNGTLRTIVTVSYDEMEAGNEHIEL